MIHIIPPYFFSEHLVPWFFLLWKFGLLFLLLCFCYIFTVCYDFSLLFPDNSECDEQQKQSELQVQSSNPAAGVSHPGGAAANIPYATPPQLGVGHAMVLSSRDQLFKYSFFLKVQALPHFLFMYNIFIALCMIVPCWLLMHSARRYGITFFTWVCLSWLGNWIRILWRGFLIYSLSEFFIVVELVCSWSMWVLKSFCTIILTFLFNVYSIIWMRFLHWGSIHAIHPPKETANPGVWILKKNRKCMYVAIENLFFYGIVSHAVRVWCFVLNFNSFVLEM